MSYIDSLNRFAQSPVGLDIGRSKFNMPAKTKTTFKSGKLIPLMWKEVLPGDTFKCDLSAVVRSITPAVPVMDDSFFDIYYFFVPNRIACRHPNDWAAVCGENFNGPFAQVTEVTLENTGNFLPIGDIVGDYDGDYTVYSMSLANYLGLRIQDYTGFTAKINALPFVAYHKIWNEWFRDQNVESPIDIENMFQNRGLNVLRSVAKIHDYFTSCLPAPQKGASVSLPLGTLAPVITGNEHHINGMSSALRLRRNTDGSTATGTVGVNVGALATGSSSTNPGTNYLYPSNLYADLANATAASINAIRLAFALQKFEEKQGLGGSRYREVLKSFFGVTIPDYTVQVPEYLGGKRVPLNITQVLQTSSTDTVSPLGATGAFSNTGFNDNGFVKSFNEYGVVMAVGCVRTMQSYSQGISKSWTRNRRFDFYWTSFANLGEQPVYKYELYADSNTFVPNASASVFGYQEAWADYRYSPVLVTGNFAPDANDTTLTAWTYTNKFASAPVLNSAFIDQPASQIGDTLVVANSSYQFIGDFQFNIVAVRPMPLYSIPGLIDHH